MQATLEKYGFGILENVMQLQSTRDSLGLAGLSCDIYSQTYTNLYWQGFKFVVKLEKSEMN